MDLTSRCRDLTLSLGIKKVMGLWGTYHYSLRRNYILVASVPSAPSGLNGQHHQEHPPHPLPMLFKLCPCLWELSFVKRALVSSSAAAVPLSGCGYPLSGGSLALLDLSCHHGHPWWPLGSVWLGCPQQGWSWLWLVLPACSWSCLLSVSSEMTLGAILGLLYPPCQSVGEGLGFAW